MPGTASRSRVRRSTALRMASRPGCSFPTPRRAKYGPLADAAGNPFYFVGLPKLIYNGQAFAPYGPRTVSGSTPLSSGVLSPAGPKAKPATVTLSFPKAGSYKLYCTVHPGMTATVVVKPAGTPVPETPAQVQAQALQDTTRSVGGGEAGGGSSQAAGEHGLPGGRLHDEPARLLPKDPQDQGRHHRQLRQQVPERGAQPRLRPEEVHRRRSRRRSTCSRPGRRRRTRLPRSCPTVRSPRATTPTTARTTATASLRRRSPRARRPFRCRTRRR